MRVLIVEDDLKNAAYPRTRLESLGHTVADAPNGRDGLLLGAEPGHDVIVLDRMLPELDGLTVVKRLRSAGRTPVLFLTILSGIDDRVEGLAAGGDDYLIKPFAFAELLARLTALSRRLFQIGAPSPETGGWQLAFNTGVDQYYIASDVPESSTWAMMVIGFAGLGVAAYRSRKAPALAA